MMGVDCIDRISELPDPILHTILSTLPRAEGVRTSSLSKRWNRVWETYPDLTFDQYTYTNVPLFVTEADITPESTQLIANFLDSVMAHLLKMRSSPCDLLGHRFRLYTSLVAPELASKLDDCFHLALGSGAAEIGIWHLAPHVFRRGGGYDVLPETVFVPNPSEYRYLRVLSLSGISLGDRSMSDVLLSCPNIRKLALLGIKGLRKLDIRKLGVLEELTIHTVRRLSARIIDAPKLRRFRFSDYLSTDCTLELSLCRSLRELNISEVAISDDFFRSLVTRCPLLEALEVETCEMLQEVIIVSVKRLTNLVLRNCNGVGAVEIDAPTLFSFTYEAKTLGRLSMKNIPYRLNIVQTMTWSQSVDTSRFIKLRRFLVISTHADCLTVIVNPYKVFFDCKELRQAEVPPAFQLEHLKIELRGSDRSFDEQALVDGLLWSCHPKTISVFLKDCTLAHNFITIIRECLLGTKKNPTCCGSSRVKCWRHNLKSSRMERFEQVSPSNAKIPIMCFELEWDDLTW